MDNILFLFQTYMSVSQHKDFDIFSLKYVAASFFATYFSGVMHPLDLIKTRFQSKTFNNTGHDGRSATENLVPKYTGIKNALSNIYQN